MWSYLLCAISAARALRYSAPQVGDGLGQAPDVRRNIGDLYRAVRSAPGLDYLCPLVCGNDEKRYATVVVGESGIQYRVRLNCCLGDPDTWTCQWNMLSIYLL